MSRLNPRFSKARSAGTLWFFSNRINSPTRIEEYGADLVCGPPSRVAAVSTPDGSRIKYLVEFASFVAEVSFVIIVCFFAHHHEEHDRERRDVRRNKPCDVHREQVAQQR